MGVITKEEEFQCAVAPHRLFHALFIDAHELTPKIMPHVVKSVTLVSGDGSPGSVMQVDIVDGHPMKYVKNRLDLEDKDNFVCKYTVIECPAFGDKIDHISHEVKLTPDRDGCMCKVRVSIQLKGDVVEEELKAEKENSMELYQTVFFYEKELYQTVIKHLIENPTLYA